MNESYEISTVVTVTESKSGWTVKLGDATFDVTSADLLKSLETHCEDHGGEYDRNINTEMLYETLMEEGE